MAMKKKLTKAEFDKLSDTMKAEYISDGADGYKLDLTDDEDIGPLRRALEREKADKNTSAARVRELEAQLEELSSNDARKAGDIGKLEKQWQKKLDDQKTDSEKVIGKLTAHTTKSLRENVATSIATKISKAPAVLLPHIQSRLVVDFEGDEPKTVVLGKDGKPSAMTVDELAAEFVANKDFASIIIATKASGGAGKPSQQHGSGATNNAGQSGDKPPMLSQMKPQELAAHLKEAKANQTSE